MTDKQIIIDDLDTRCPHHCSDTIGQCLNISKDTPSPYCIYNKDCVYKQLARKEQECKDLREDIKDIANLLDLDTGEEYNFGNIELEIKQLKAKEQECEELKKANDEKNELLIKLGCPTTATAKRKVLYLEKELEKIKEINNEIKTDLKNWDERFKLQNAFIDNLLKATNNSIWIDKSISDEEASEIIEKIEMDYIEFEEGKEIYAELKVENEELKEQFKLAEPLYQACNIKDKKIDKLKQTFAEIKEFVENEMTPNCDTNIILQKINEVENGKNM